MDDVARLSAGDRADIFAAAAVRLKDHGLSLQPLLLEKDFWVCWVLARLFALRGLPPLLFKGGTSLSKCYSLIARFSEDVDLVFDRAHFGFSGERDPAFKDVSGKGHGTNQQRRLLDDLRKTCTTYIGSDFVQSVKADFRTVLGDTSWNLELDPADPDSLQFQYPTSFDKKEYSTSGYVRPSVKLELGMRGDRSPCEMRSVAPYVADARFKMVSIAPFNVNALLPKRTFWEKVLIHHVEYHREPDKPTKLAYSRHFYDLATLGDTPIAAEAIGDAALRTAVVDHTRTFFRSAKAAVYDSAVPGSFRLVPKERDRIEALRADYSAMAPMFFKEAPSWTGILDKLTALEQRINSTAT